MLAEQIEPEPGVADSGLQIHVSKLLLTSIVAAIATSVAMIVATVMTMQGPPPPPPGMPPPPPRSDSLIIVITGMFVVSWLAVLVTLARDQILHRLRQLPESDGVRSDPSGLMAALRRDLADDRRADLEALESRIAALTSEYGEQRETDGYVNGMRVATRGNGPSAEVRPLHRVPPTA